MPETSCTHPVATVARVQPPSRRQTRGTARREAIIAAAAALVLEVGPAAVTHRGIAARAEVPLAATTYYFASLDDLVGEAGARLARRWADHAAAVAAGAPTEATLEEQARALADAVLPEGGEPAIRGHYEHLVSAGRSPALARAYAAGRSGLDAAVAQLLRSLGLTLPPALVVALVDGAAVTALSEGHDIRARAAALLEHVLLGESVRA